MIEADPSATMEIVLEKHKDLPPATRPAFVFRPLRRRDAKRLSALLNDLRLLAANGGDDIGAAEEAMEAIEEFIAGQLVTWRNQTDERGQPLPCRREDLDRAIDDAGLGEIALKLRRGAELSSAEKKGSGLPSPSRSAPVPPEAPEAAPVVPAAAAPAAAPGVA